MFTYKKIWLFNSTYFLILHSMTFDLISGLHMQIQTWQPPLRLCIHAKYQVKSGLTNVLKNANKTKNMHLFSIQIANYNSRFGVHRNGPCEKNRVIKVNFYEGSMDKMTMTLKIVWEPHHDRVISKSVLHVFCLF